MLLQPGELGIAELDAEVAARDHHGGGLVDDGLEVVDGLAPLDLGDDAALAAGRAQQVPGLRDVVPVAHEGDREVVDAELRGHADVFAVLGGQRAGGQSAALLVEALLVGELAAGQDARVHLRAFDAGDLERDQAVVQQQRVARRARRAAAIRRRRRRCRRVPAFGSSDGSSVKRSPSASMTLPAAKRSMRTFGTAQVAEDADHAALLRAAARPRLLDALARARRNCRARS